MSKKSVFQISISFKKHLPADSSLLVSLLPSIGVPYGDIVTENSKKGETVFFYVSSKKTLSLVSKRLASLNLKGLNVRVSDLSGIGWRDKWKKGYTPFKINDTFTIVPSWMKKNKKWDIERTIFLDIGMAFGSGLHTTTRFVSRLMDKKKNSLGDFLDVGTGSGILSIMAKKYGATNVSSIDCDPEAIRVARKNFTNNSVAIPFIQSCDLKKFQTKNGFDFVAANLQTKIFLDYRKSLISLVRPGKYLAVSGIAACNYSEFREKFDGSSLRCIKILHDKEWSALLYKKTV